MRVDNNGEDLRGNGKVGLGMMGEAEGIQESTTMVKKEMVKYSINKSDSVSPLTSFRAIYPPRKGKGESPESFSQSYKDKEKI